MKKTIIILTGSIIATSILWLADKKLLNKTSDPESAENQKKRSLYNKVRQQIKG